MCRSTAIKIFYSVAVSGPLQSQLVSASFCTPTLVDAAHAGDALTQRLLIGRQEAFIGNVVKNPQRCTWQLRTEHMRRRDQLIANLEKIFPKFPEDTHRQQRRNSIDHANQMDKSSSMISMEKPPRRALLK